MTIILNEINYFWKLGYNEEMTDIYVKVYQNSYGISINIAEELINYGDKIKVSDLNLNQFSQRNFIILEAIDRFLTKEYKPEDIHIGGDSTYNFAIENGNGGIFIAIQCLEWLEEYDKEIDKLKTKYSIVQSFFKNNSNIEYLCVYTSRLKAGTIECRYTIFPHNYSVENSYSYTSGLLEVGIQAYFPKFKTTINGIQTEKNVNNNNDFEITNGELIKYNGNSTHVIIPFGVEKLKNSVFWNCQSVEKITIPDTVYSLGGDTFYYCENLTKLTIPKSITIIGDNPFANCPKLDLVNKSPHFIFEDGILYNKNKNRLIYCAIKRKSKICEIPESVLSISKHSFYNCIKLRKIVIPPSVKIIENNPFSNLPLLKLENNSPHFIFKDGALYNKTMTTLFYYEHGTKSKHLMIPEGVKIIGRHSFYNCKTIERITIPASVKIIGYNPFTNCSSLKLINNSPEFAYENGALYNKKKNELIYYSISNTTETFVVPSSVKKIGRSAFFGCFNLRRVELPEGLLKIDRSAFANCINIKEINIPKSVESIGEWTFLNCVNLKNIMLPKHVLFEQQSFLNCPVEIKKI